MDKMDGIRKANQDCIWYLHCLTKLRIVVTVIVHYVFSLGL